jgi:hypothetical protein
VFLVDRLDRSAPGALEHPVDRRPGHAEHLRELFGGPVLVLVQVERGER